MELSAKMPRRKRDHAQPEKALDTFYGRRGRGRPGVRASEIAGRASNYRYIFGLIWDKVGDSLIQAKTEAEVIGAFEREGRYTSEFGSVASIIVKVLHEPRFPQKREARINFLADSLAGRGRVSPRRSRDICEQERAKERKKSRYKIIRH